MALAEAGARRAYGLPGDDMAAAHAMRAAGVALVVTSEQRGGAYAAAGDAAVTASSDPRAFGVVIAGRGPGAAALVPALLELGTGCHPVVCLIGGPPSGADARSFQYADQEALLRAVVKQHVRLMPESDIATVVLDAISIALTAPRGPVVIEIPDPPPQSSTGEEWATPAHPRPEAPAAKTGTASARTARPRDDEAAITAISASRRPLILVGGGARAAGPAVVRLAEAMRAPILATASGRGAVSEDHSLWWGLSGLYMHPVVRAAVSSADLLIGIGSRLEETATEYFPRLPVVRLDRDPDIVCRPNELLVVADATHAESWVEVGDGSRRDGWGDVVPRVRQRLSAWRRSVRSGERGARDRLGAIVAAVSDALPRGVILCHENGSADMWSYLCPILRLPPGAIDIAPSEQTTLGFGVGAAAGAARAGERPVVVLCGDGAFDLVVRERAAFGPGAPGVVYVVFDNGGYGWLEAQHRVSADEAPVFTGLGAIRSESSRGTPLPSRSILDANHAATVMSWAFDRAATGPVVVRVPCLVDEGAPVGLDTW